MTSARITPVVHLSEGKTKSCLFIDRFTLFTLILVRNFQKRNLSLGNESFSTVGYLIFHQLFLKLRMLNYWDFPEREFAFK